MSQPLLYIHDVANSNSFRQRLTPGIAQTAMQVLQESPGDKPFVYQKRRELAQRALRDPELVSNEFVWPVLSNAAIAAAGVSAPDGDLLYQISAIWSVVAGVTTDDEAYEPVVPD